MLIVTAPDIKNGKIRDYNGIVIGEALIGANIQRYILRGQGCGWWKNISL